MTVLIHTGSRGLGHQVCTDYVEGFLKAVPKYEIEFSDGQLTAAPIESPEGEQYLKGMSAAANIAFANRQLITHFVRRTFGAAGREEHGLKVFYELAHNNAKSEEHRGKRVLVHRKGATRAFGPGEEDLPIEYRLVGSRSSFRGHGPLLVRAGRNGESHERDLRIERPRGRKEVEPPRAKRAARGATSSGRWGTRE